MHALLLSLLMQETASGLLQKFVTAHEKKDVALYNLVTGRKWTQEKFDRNLEKLELKFDGHGLDGLKKAPPFASPHPDVELVNLCWVLPHGEGHAMFGVELVQKQGRWGFGYEYAKTESFLEPDEKVVPGKETAAPGEILKTWALSVEKKEYALLKGLLYSRKLSFLGEWNAERCEEEEKSCGGHWLEALRRIPVLGACDDSLLGAKIEVEYPTANGTVKATVPFVKENKEWKLFPIMLRVKLEKK